MRTRSTPSNSAPYDSLAELHGELSNHAGTFANEVAVTADAS